MAAAATRPVATEVVAAAVDTLAVATEDPAADSPVDTEVVAVVDRSAPAEAADSRRSVEADSEVCDSVWWEK